MFQLFSFLHCTKTKRGNKTYYYYYYYPTSTTANGTSTGQNGGGNGEARRQDLQRADTVTTFAKF